MPSRHPTHVVLSSIFLWFLAFISVNSLSSDKEASQFKQACRFDRNNPWQRIKIFDIKDGVPYVNENGALRKSSRILEEVPYFNVEAIKSKTIDNIYDLRLGNEYLAILSDGSFQFTSSSTNGSSTPLAINNQKYLTTIFTISCDGNLAITANLPNSFITAKRLSVQTRDFVLSPSRDHIDAKWSVTQPTSQDNITFYSPVLGPMISSAWQTGQAPRCPAPVPLGLTPYVKPGARGSYYNGCGAENGMKVPDLRFEQCCNRHDLCYDNCGMSWEACNDDFRECNHVACEVAYPLPPNVTASRAPSSTLAAAAVPPPAAGNASAPGNVTVLGNGTVLTNGTPDWWNNTALSWLNWGCHNLADTYADAVNSFIGAWAFQASNVDRCECRCPLGSFDCGDACMMECDDDSLRKSRQVQDTDEEKLSKQWLEHT